MFDFEHSKSITKKWYIMFPRKALDMVILSILNNNPDGLTGYSIVKAMKEKFGTIGAPSPGTIYPRLKKLLVMGDIVGKDEEFKISSQGKQKLTQNIPGIIDNSREFMPMLYSILMRSLPYVERLNYLPDLSGFFEHPGHAHHRNFLDDSIFPEECQCTSDLSESLGRLQAIKDRLLRAKQEIQERLSARLQAIDDKIQFIDERIKECQAEKESRVKIPIEDGDSKTE